MFGMSQQQQVALIQQMAQLQLMNGMQKSPSNIAGGKQWSKNCNTVATENAKLFRKIIAK